MIFRSWCRRSHGMRNELNSSKEAGNRPPPKLRSKKHSRESYIDKHQYKRVPRQERIEERKQLKALAQVVARRAKPKDWAKVAGNPWSVTIRAEASEGRALRAARCSHERRQWARWARVKTAEVSVATGAAGAPLVKRTVSLRMTLSQARRMPQRGQSFHSSAARGKAAGGSCRGGEASEGTDSRGHNTALTRRGLTLSLRS